MGQKKGFIVYLKVGSIAQVDTCMRLLDRYSETLRNIAIAKSKSSAREPTSEARNSAILQASKGTIEDFVPEVHIPQLCELIENVKICPSPYFYCWLVVVIFFCFAWICTTVCLKHFFFFMLSNSWKCFFGDMLRNLQRTLY